MSKLEIKSDTQVISAQKSCWNDTNSITLNPRLKLLGAGWYSDLCLFFGLDTLDD